MNSDAEQFLALMGFGQQAAKHMTVFGSFAAACERGFDVDLEIIGPAADILARFLTRDTLAMGLLALHLECATQPHSLRATRDGEDIDEHRTYLFTVARSRLFDALRKRQRNPGATDIAELSLADVRTSPSTWLAREGDRRLLVLALERLPLELHLALELFYFEDMTAREVARVLDLPEGTVRSRVRGAIEMLREEIERLGELPEATREALGRWRR